MSTPAITRAINAFEEAVRMDEMKGTYSPDQAKEVSEFYEMRKKSLLLCITRALISARRTEAQTNKEPRN